MQVAVYAVKLRDRWWIEVSLDIRVDLRWWMTLDTSLDMSLGLLADRFVLLARSMPLGWAVSLRDGFRSERVMDRWGLKEWREYVRNSLAVCVAEEPYGQGDLLLGHADEMAVWTAEQMDGLDRGLNAAAAWDKLLLQAERLAQLLEGRALLSGEVELLLEEAGGDMSAGWLAAAQLGCLLGRLRVEAGLAQPAPREKPGWLRRSRTMAPRCRRCGSEALSRTACATCGSAACAYCEACLAMGRSRSCALLLQGAAHSAVRGTAGGSPTAALGRWGLSAAQGAAAGAALRFLAEPPAAGSAAARFLIWAVTGAGKTEMIFPLLQSVLDAGGRVLVAAPRRDVVLELAPRLAAAFPGVSIATLYGGSPDRWKRGSITLATTHQLLRFRHAFDLVVIDEIDAFPYHNDPMLDFAAKGACKPGGKYIYLSATPPINLQREAAAGRLPHAKVPARFHGHPLPVPKPLKVPSVQRCLTQKSLPPGLVRELKVSLQRGAQVFLFVSRIRHIEPFLQLLRRYFKDIPIEGTSSVDSGRAEKVMSFRKRDIRLLVTTTILERGVTVPKSDVFIVDADSELFDEAALIQMAGRAGRSKDDPAGRVIFGSPQWTRCQRSAMNQIKRMNRIAKRGGYLQC
ncbi:DEAD/DEAH box helicase [Paenibacillus sp. GCM10028914]|uniref:DEAD/DEAH box helicase n=1 Tax=Paenibacillus sp. GCM10028914 TaxID=3273416 RepID=UPI00361FC98C